MQLGYIQEETGGALLCDIAYLIPPGSLDFNFFSRTVASADNVSGPEQGRF